MPLTAQWKQAVELHQRGKLSQAERLYRAILDAHAEHAEASHMLGMLLHQDNRSEDSLAWLSRAIEIAGEQPVMLANTAKVYIERGEPEAAMALLDRSLRIAPEHFGSLFNRALALQLLSQPADALRHAERAAERQPDNSRVHVLIATQLGQLGRYSEQIKSLERALQLGADPVDCRLTIAAAHLQLNQSQAARALLQELPAKCRISAADLFQAVRLFQQLGGWVDVQQWTTELIRREPEHYEAIFRRGLASAQLGDPENAISDYQRVIELQPAYHQVHSNLLSIMQYDPRFSPQDVLLTHRAWAQQHVASQPRAALSFSASRDAERTLRVGWLSPRFDSSLIVSFLPATLKAMPTDEFSHFFYGTRSGGGEIASDLKGLGEHRQVGGLSDDELASQIERDGIDILMDLCGHNAGNRLLAVARRMAPIQMCWLDYFSTTGIAAMDYWLTDPHMSPSGSEELFSENLLRLPQTRLAYAAPAFNVTPWRSKRKPNEVVFGSFNRLGKIVDQVVTLWTDIVNAQENARLILTAAEFHDPRVRDLTRQRFARAGLVESRLELRPATSYKRLMEQYADIDIALDPFPFTGYATTCDALWMGVPVITLAGNTIVARQGVSVLQNLGKPQWIADNTEQYKRTASECAADMIKHGWDRTALRTDFENCPVCDAQTQSVALSRLLRQSWRAHCDP